MVAIPDFWISGRELFVWVRDHDPKKSIESISSHRCCVTQFHLNSPLRKILQWVHWQKRKCNCVVKTNRRIVRQQQVMNPQPRPWDADADAILGGELALKKIDWMIMMPRYDLKKTNTIITSKYFWEPNAWNYQYNRIIYHCVEKLFLQIYGCL